MAKSNLTREELLAPFAKKIEPIPKQATYHIGLWLAAIVMVILPLVYLAMICGLAYGVYYHATHNHVMLDEKGRDGRGALMVYLLPIFAGSIAVLFMIKPLFAPRYRPPNRRKLDPEKEPLLFEFVNQLCEAVRAPKPRQIQVDTEVNASASFRNGLWSIAGNDLVLTIGLPLAAGMSLRQLTGVLAHEFGHFAQGGGMRLTLVIRTISMWFARLVYERDVWDRRLSGVANSGIHISINLMGWMGQLGVWLSRRVLWVLMHLGNIASCYLLRQMEYDADRYECRVAGSDTFISTVFRLHELNVANQAAFSDLSASFRENRLADDFPKLVVANLDYISEKPVHLQKIREHLLAAKTGSFDTHPSDSDRIRNAKNENATGTFQIEAPAAILFAKFVPLCKAVTIEYYKEHLEEFKSDSLVPTEQIYREQIGNIRSGESFRRYFQDQYPASYRLFPEIPDGHEASQIAERIAAARERMLKIMPSVKEAAEKYSDWNPTETSSVASKLMNEFDRRASERLRLALGWARMNSTEELDPEGLLEKVGPTLEAIQSNWNSVCDVRRQFLALGQQLEQAVSKGANQQQINAINAGLENLRKSLKQLKNMLTGSPYPFLHGDGKIDLATFAIPKVPSDSHDMGAVMEVGHRVLDQLDGLYSRILFGLVAVAERAEDALGLTRLPDPVDEPVSNPA